MSQIIIRNMTVEEAPGIAAWMVEMMPWKRYHAQTERTAQQFITGIGSGEDLYLVAEAEGDVIGFAVALAWASFGRGPYLRLLAVREGNTGGGIGAQLLAGVEAWVAAHWPDLFILAADFNDGAHRFYQRHGYTHIGTIPHYVVPGVAEFIFYKKVRTENH